MMLNRNWLRIFLLASALFGMGVVAWSPLAMGMLTGKYDEGLPEGSRFSDDEELRGAFFSEANQAKVRALKEVADGVGLTRTQLALAWVLRHTQMSCAITGATKPSQIEESLGAAGVDLPGDVLDRIDEVLG